ncbi:MAG: Stk1 family PASTA domain-containing Ser/Thr kinase [Lachnospiraceae bacterium]|nr:Stk1 family PASTA domain-containing Ser/Thr kinase [Lachnospiraceae bacterium]
MIRKGMFIGDRYEVIDKVGSGGMSDVYKAKDHKLNRFVAVKVLKSEFCEDKGFVSKFKIEAQSAAGLAHPNIVNVYDVGEDQGIYYIVMELIEGITLKKYIEKKGKLPVKDAISIAIQVAQGIEAAHNNHIVHRDIKPQNIIISREGKVKVTDFGIARAASANTINSNAMGSVHYISPEQARGGYIDEKSDIYSLGITLYEMITGRVPFEGDSTVTIALQHIQEEIPSAKMFVPDLPVSVAKIIEKCAQKKPERRYLKVSSLIADLKKSLISPDEDFVVIAPVTNNNATIMITDDEISVIKENAGKVSAEEPVELTDENEVEQNEVTEDDEWMSASDDIDEGNPKLDKIVAIGAIIAGIVILIVLILIISKGMDQCGGTSEPVEETTTVDEANNAKNTKVPSVLGLKEAEATAALEAAGLKYTIKRETSDKVEAGLVIKQSVDPDTVVSKSTTVIITISEGGAEFEIPDVIGKSYSEAMKILSDAGLEVNPIYEKSDEHEDNTVFKTSPEYPIKLKKGDRITIYVSLGEDEMAEIPDLSGKMKDEAEEALKELGFEVAFEEEYHETLSEGRVIGTDLEPGTKLPKGETVTLIISLGEEPTESETTTEEETEADKFTVSFYVQGMNIPQIEVPVDNSGEEPGSEDATSETTETTETTESSENTDEPETQLVPVSEGKLSAIITYKDGDKNVEIDVTTYLPNATFSADYPESFNVKYETEDDVEGVVATLTITLTYGDGMVAEIYTSQQAFN